MTNLDDDPTAYATDASLIVRVLRMADTGQWELPDKGRVMLDRAGTAYPAEEVNA